MQKSILASKVSNIKSDCNAVYDSPGIEIVFPEVDLKEFASLAHTDKT